jgi:hypothetical protein
METSLKFFIIALCITKLIALLVLCRHGKGFFASWWKGMRARSGRNPRARFGRDVAMRPPDEQSVCFCQFTLYRKVIRAASLPALEQNDADSFVASNGMSAASPSKGGRR